MDAYSTTGDSSYKTHVLSTQGIWVARREIQLFLKWEQFHSQQTQLFLIEKEKVDNAQLNGSATSGSYARSIHYNAICYWSTLSKLTVTAWYTLGYGNIMQSYKCAPFKAKIPVKSLFFPWWW